jgi:hypothetical protein
MHDVDAGQRLEQLGREVLRGAVPVDEKLILPGFAFA